MLNKTINKLAKSLVEVSVTVDWADIAPFWDQTVQRLAADLELPGFRKGAAPVNLAEQNLGPKVQDEFLKVVMPQKLIEALQGSEVVPIDYPKYQLTSFSKSQPLVYKATVTERPVVKIGDYKTINVARPQAKTITDEDVDKVVIDLFNRWKAKGGTLSASTPVAPVPTQADQASSATGGTISFNQPQTPAAPVQPTTDTPNDDFAKAIGAANLLDLKTKVRADLENEAKFNTELDFEEAILQQISGLTQVEIPEILVDDELNRMLVSLQRRVSEVGMLLEDYLKRQNMDVNSWKDKYREQAEKNVKMELGLSEVARAENVIITDTEIQEEINRIPDARMKAQFEQEEPRLQLRHSLRQMKTLDLLKRLVH